ncbi:hypothetical protein PoB_004275400 [Plakobranchus ocellatus]|uniref:Uncharacterized protein n=1 Tax=Plakobranchus ocellatus TaxID=259542 RepID=A0AAV4B850_9GAST|nr:hypothetical protein PoB_004275400 [Plakobranchus ocellatus]
MSQHDHYNHYEEEHFLSITNLAVIADLELMNIISAAIINQKYSSFFRCLVWNRDWRSCSSTVLSLGALSGADTADHVPPLKPVRCLVWNRDWRSCSSTQTC